MSGSIFISCYPFPLNVFSLFFSGKLEPRVTTRRTLDFMLVESINKARSRLANFIIMKSNLNLVRISVQRVVIDFSVRSGSSGLSPRQWFAIFLFNAILVSFTNTVNEIQFEGICTSLCFLSMNIDFNQKK